MIDIIGISLLSFVIGYLFGFLNAYKVILESYHQK